MGEHPTVIDAPGDIDDIQISLMRTLASRHRLRILHALGDGPMDVTEIARVVAVSQPVASQHLAAMRAAGIVEAQRDGRSVRYTLVDPGLLAACGLMRDVIVRRLSRLGALAAAAGGAAQPSITRPGPVPFAPTPIEDCLP
jgi:DNA-binding transcriptional ArsR family regulator